MQRIKPSSLLYFLFLLVTKLSDSLFSILICDMALKHYNNFLFEFLKIIFNHYLFYMKTTTTTIINCSNNYIKKIKVRNYHIKTCHNLRLRDCKGF